MAMFNSNLVVITRGYASKIIKIGSLPILARVSGGPPPERSSRAQHLLGRIRSKRGESVARRRRGWDSADHLAAMVKSAGGPAGTYPLVICYIAIEHGPVEIVIFPIKNGGSFH